MTPDRRTLLGLGAAAALVLGLGVGARQTHRWLTEDSAAPAPSPLIMNSAGQNSTVATPTATASRSPVLPTTPRSCPTTWPH